MRVLLLALVALVAAIVARPAHEWPSSVPAESTNGIVVLDLSASISSDTYQRIGQTLHELSSTNGRYGLVVFSDVAYEALPPGTPAAELKPYARYFTLPPPKRVPADVPAQSMDELVHRRDAHLGRARARAPLIRKERLKHPASSSSATSTTTRATSSSSRASRSPTAG